MKAKKHSKRFSTRVMPYVLTLALSLSVAPLGVHAATYNATTVALTPGTNISQLNLDWYSTSNTASLVQVALKSAMTGPDFPEASSTSFYTTRASAASGYYSNKAVISSLSPSTEYVYRLGDGNGNWSPVYNYKTGAVDQFSFLAVGDPQIGAGNTSSDTTGWDDTLTKAFNQFPSSAFVVSAGDQVNTNNNESQFTGFFTPSELKNLPVAPALGNHDNGAANHGYHYHLPNLSTQYGVTNPGSADYYYTYGNTLFIVLNTNNTSGTSHQTFIQNAVAANPTATWKVVTFHHDIYGSGSHALESTILNLRAALYPVFDSCGIDVVITGHDHSYTRTHVMKGDVPQLNQTYDQNGAVVNPNGTVYFTLNSASGSKYYGLNATQADYVAVRSQINVPTFSHVSINGNTLSFKTYRTDTMAQTDTFSIVKDSTTPPPPSGNTFERRVSSSLDDVEENLSGGSIDATSTDLELITDGTKNQIVGVRFNNVTIPQGATITNAYIQFTCDETSTGSANLKINGEASNNPSAFTTSSYSVSNRTKTTAQASWSPAAWNTVGEAGANQRTSDIKNVVQEIVNRGGWTSGNSMAMFITGDNGNRRCAESYNGSSTQAPLIHIEYTTN